MGKNNDMEGSAQFATEEFYISNYKKKLPARASSFFLLFERALYQVTNDTLAYQFTEIQASDMNFTTK